MALTIKSLKAYQTADATKSILYTATGVTTVVSSLRVTNNTGTAQTVSFWIEDTSGTPVEKFWVKDVSVPANTQGQGGSSVSIPGEITLSVGYKLKIQGSGGSGGLHVLVSGCERS